VFSTIKNSVHISVWFITTISCKCRCRRPLPCVCT